MVFVPFCEILGCTGEALVCPGFVPFIFEGDEYTEEPPFLVAGCEVRPGETGERHRSMMVGNWSRWGIFQGGRLESGARGEGVRGSG